MRGQIRDGACADRGDSFRPVSGCRPNRCPQHVGLCVSSCPGNLVLPVINSPARQACTGSQCPACCLEVTESKRQPLLPKNIWAVGTVQGGHHPDRFYDVRLEPLASGHSPHPRRPVAYSVHPADTDLCPSPQRQAGRSFLLDCKRAARNTQGWLGKGKLETLLPPARPSFQPHFLCPVEKTPGEKGSWGSSGTRTPLLSPCSLRAQHLCNAS